MRVSLELTIGIILLVLIGCEIGLVIISDVNDIILKMYNIIAISIGGVLIFIGMIIIYLTGPEIIIFFNKR